MTCLPFFCCRKTRKFSRKLSGVDCIEDAVFIIIDPIAGIAGRSTFDIEFAPDERCGANRPVIRRLPSVGSMNMDSQTSKPKGLSQLFLGSGCLWMLATMAISGVLLVFNAVFCISLYFGFVSQLDESSRGLRGWLESSAVSQLFMFVAPVLFLAIQWLLFDALRDHLTHRGSRDRR